MPLILEFVNKANGLSTESAESLEDDKIGEQTIQFLEKRRKLERKLNTFILSL